MEGAGIRSVNGEAEAVADHGADEGTFDVTNGKHHGGNPPRADRPYQSRQEEGGKRESMTAAALAAVMVPAFCAATWQQSVALTILSAGALLWLVPVDPRWWARRISDEAGEEPSPAARSAADIGLILGCWALATWALWQHRVLPLIVCAAAAVLVMLDVISRPAAPAPLCIPERTRRRPIVDPDPQLQP